MNEQKRLQAENDGVKIVSVIIPQAVARVHILVKQSVARAVSEPHPHPTPLPTAIPGPQSKHVSLQHSGHQPFAGETQSMSTAPAGKHRLEKPLVRNPSGTIFPSSPVGRKTISKEN